MKSNDLEKLFKESIEKEEDTWTNRSQIELRTAVVEDKQESTEIFFSNNTVPTNERLSETSEPSNSAFLGKLLAVVLWLSGAAILLWTFKDFLGF